MGTGTLVSPAAVTLGPVPAFPLLAALPAPGTPAAWVGALVAAPVLAAVAGTVLMLRRHPVLTYDAGALRGLGAGVVGGLLLSAGIALAGGAVGPGRMADVGRRPARLAGRLDGRDGRRRPLRRGRRHLVGPAALTGRGR